MSFRFDFLKFARSYEMMILPKVSMAMAFGGTDAFVV